MCGEIVAFANSIEPNTSRSVELLTDWGGKFTKNPETIFSKTCIANHYQPGEKFCQYLLAHTSTEFADINFKRAVACVGGGFLATKNPIHISEISAEVAASEVVGIRRDVTIQIKVSTGTNEKGPRLKITAESDVGNE